MWRATRMRLSTTFSDVWLVEAEIIHSKGGKGFHVRLYFDPDHLPLARTRNDHIINCQRSLIWLSGRVGLDLGDMADAVGVVAWIWHVDRKPGGFELIKQSTANMPKGWECEFPQHVKTSECDLPEHQDHPVTIKHSRVIDFLTQRGFGEQVGKFFRTHTHNLLAAQDELKLSGNFATLATGKDGPADRNCWIVADANGSFRVYRYGKNTKEHESWWKSPAGWTTCWFNRGKEKADPTSSLVVLAKNDDLFHDSTGRTYTTTPIRGVKETLQLSDPQYRAKLRLAYTEHTGRIVTGDALATAIDQLAAIALLDRPEYPIAIRIAEHDGCLYIDLADQDRRLIKVTPGNWSIVDDAPVRFVRPFGMLPLPTPLTGGSLTELREFINVEDDDLPLLLAFVVGCFHPTGPYGLLQVVGEQGSAKSSLMRLVHDIVDPHIAIGNTLPKDERDLLVAAQLRWLVSFDNVWK